MGEECAYSFWDLFDAALKRQPTPEEKKKFLEMTQKERNDVVKELANKAGWGIDDRIGSDGQLYTAFCPLWISGTTEPLDEECPTCGEKLVLYTTAKGKKMKKCSTAGWDAKAKKATGCTYVQWLKADEYQQYDKTASGGEEFLPPEPPEDDE